MATAANEPAFSAGVPEGGYHYPGLTIRDYFAAMAMQALLSQTPVSESASEIARQSAFFADALITELSKPQP